MLLPEMDEGKIKRLARNPQRGTCAAFLTGLLLSDTLSGWGVAGRLEVHGLAISVRFWLDYRDGSWREGRRGSRVVCLLPLKQQPRLLSCAQRERESNTAGSTPSPLLGLCKHLGLPRTVTSVQRNSSVSF